MRIALAAALAALSALSACATKADRTGLVSRGFYSPDFDTVWDVAQMEMQRTGFAPDHDASSKEARTLTSRWSNHMSPFSGRGYREQATLTFREVPDQPNRWTVEANVIREQNMAIVAPQNPIVAKWENPVRVPESEHLLASNVERFFLPRDVSSAFRSRYGMPSPKNEEESPRAPGDGPSQPKSR
jgi:hypothetical protein